MKRLIIFIFQFALINGCYRRNKSNFGQGSIKPRPNTVPCSCQVTKGLNSVGFKRGKGKTVINGKTRPFEMSIVKYQYGRREKTIYPGSFNSVNQMCNISLGNIRNLDHRRTNVFGTHNQKNKNNTKWLFSI